MQSIVSRLAQRTALYCGELWSVGSKMIAGGRDARGPGGFRDVGPPYRAGAMEDTAHDCAAYIAELTLQLRNLAHRQRFKFLTLLLEMAFQEAFALSPTVPAPKS